MPLPLKRKNANGAQRRAYRAMLGGAAQTMLSARPKSAYTSPGRDGRRRQGDRMSKSSRSNGPALNRRELLRLSTVAGVGAVLPASSAFADLKAQQADVPAGPCSTPRSAVATTQYGKVRGYVDDGVLTFKGVPYGAPTGGENRWRPAKAPSPWTGEYPALIYGANCPQRLHDWVSEQSFLFQW